MLYNATHGHTLHYIYKGRESMRKPAMLALEMPTIELPSASTLGSMHTFTSTDTSIPLDRHDRPCLLMGRREGRHGQQLFRICAMATFRHQEKPDLAEVHQYFVLPVSPNIRDPGALLVQTTSPWKDPYQWIMAYEYDTSYLGPLWKGSAHGTGFHLSQEMFDAFNAKRLNLLEGLRERAPSGSSEQARLQKDLKDHLTKEYLEKQKENRKGQQNEGPSNDTGPKSGDSADPPAQAESQGQISLNELNVDQRPSDDSKYSSDDEHRYIIAMEKVS
ncbi:hypothetical protein FA95DRAFT_1036345 [Auriscalpium vulgare]|uniref:Uncharacterized protein n=1 Tax=Auriscalpium vulgare TaxID=40419 RepID=A0ACB8R5A6_9AGAM|nr:hypothetical protein FA95DRAFT_1036345 [Auriscalpium vulgare]